MQIQPYLFFDGSCEQALAFYQSALGAKVEMMMHYKESPDPAPPGCSPKDGERIMYVAFRVGDSLVMASDTPEGQHKGMHGFSLSLTVASKEEAAAKFAALSPGGNVFMPLGPTFFSPAFGMLTDRFGVQWMVVTQ
jgi:PhnB protein